MSEVVGPVQDYICEFAKNQLLMNNDFRDDYREFLELSLIFLGDSPPRGIHFMAPGAMHFARWMSKVIYSLKVWLFHGQFKLTSFEKKGLGDMCLFAVTLYLKSWITAPLAASAPQNDLTLLQDLHRYRQHNDTISRVTCTKLEGHLWYLSEQLVALAFFDHDVPASTKRKMVTALQMDSVDDDDELEPPPNRISTTAVSASGTGLENFVTRKTRRLFLKLRISPDFLSSDPETWENRDDYKKACNIINKLQVTNDNAERGVALVQELNKRITYDEEQFQFLIQVVADHRRQYSCQKSMLQ